MPPPQGPWHRWIFTGRDGLIHHAASAPAARCMARSRAGTTRVSDAVVTCLVCIADRARGRVVPR